MNWIDDDHDWEPDESDRSEDQWDDGEVEELSCPSCGGSVYEETQQCPHCGDWITPLAASARTPKWIRIVGAILVLCFLYGIIVGIVRLFG